MPEMILDRDAIDGFRVERRRQLALHAEERLEDLPDRLAEALGRILHPRGLCRITAIPCRCPAQAAMIELAHEDDREQQIQVVEAFTSQGVRGLVLAPLDDRALVRPVEEARRAGVPTVIIDSDLASEQIVSFVATDHRKGGQLAADHLLDFGPGAGDQGGEITAAGAPSRIERRRESLTGQYLSGKKSIPVPTNRRIARVARPESSKGVEQSSPRCTPFRACPGLQGVQQALYVRSALAFAVVM